MKQSYLLIILYLSSIQILFAQDFHFVSGTVKDTKGETLPGVTVQLQGTSVGTVTNPEGYYRLRVPNEGGTLVFSFLGMKKLTQTIGAQSVLDVVMQEDVTALETIVVTGYGGERNKRDLVGSYEQISSEQLQPNRPVESFDKLLTGLVAGVQVESNTGEPGLPVRVRIRGEGSLVPVSRNDVASSGQPLYVLDGVPLYDITDRNTTNTQFSDVTEQKLNPLASLNPEDIESITVLKDAAASAIYGANAANGVVLITTKRGISGKSQVNLSINYGFQNPVNEPQFLNSSQYVALYRESLFNSGGNPSLAGSDAVNTDWRDLVTRTGTNLSANLGISGGTAQTRFRFSAGYFKQEAISKGNDIERISFRIGINHQIGKNFSMSFDLGAAFNGKTSFNSFGVTTFAPNLSPINDDGTFNNQGFFLNRPNPLAALEQNEFTHKGFATNGNITLEYQVLPSLKIRSTIGIDYYQNRQNEFRSALNGSGRSRNGYANKVDRNNQRWISFTQLVWNKKIAEKHNFNAVLGFEAQEQTTALLRATGTNFPFDGLRQLTVVSDENSSVASSDQEEATVSFYGQMGYNFDQKYIFSLNVRRDASSIFGGDVRNANFASAGLGWLISEEDFMKRFDFISLLKLRGTFGSTGNSRIGTYAARGLYRFDSGFQYGGLLGSAPIAAPNPRLSWETNLKLNLGLDITLWKGRIGLTTEFYQNRIFNAISTIDVPQETGFISIPANTANMQNTGWEFTLNTKNISKEDFTWSTNFNIAFNRNKITKLALERPPRSTEQSSGLVVGQDVSAIYGVPYAGADPYNGKPLWYLPDGSITDDVRLANAIENRVVIGTRSPDFLGGFTNNLTYKNLSLGVLMTYSVGSQILVPNSSMTDGRSLAFDNQSINLLDRWQQPGDITDVPRLHPLNFPARNNTRFLFDNTFLKIDNVNLGYSAPSAIAKKIYMSSLRCFVQINNVAYFYTTTSARNRNNIAQYRFPFPESRTVMLGLNAVF